MDQGLEKMLRNFLAECNVSGFFVMKYLRILLKHQLLDLNLYGNHQKVKRNTHREGLKPIMQESWPYIKNYDDFLKKT